MDANTNARNARYIFLLSIGFLTRSILIRRSEREIIRLVLLSFFLFFIVIWKETKESEIFWPIFFWIFYQTYFFFYLLLLLENLFFIIRCLELFFFILSAGYFLKYWFYIRPLSAIDRFKVCNKVDVLEILLWEVFGDFAAAILLNKWCLGRPCWPTIFGFALSL